MHLMYGLRSLTSLLSLAILTTPGQTHPTIEVTDSSVEITPHKSTLQPTTATPLPLLIWHGLGDKFDNPGLQSVSDLVQSIYPGTHVHIIRLGDTGDDDRSATFFGNVSEQIDQVCLDLLSDPILSSLTTGPEHTLHVNALGFSQGGQFLRGLLQRCAPLRVHTLLTFGSQHNGIAQFQRCGPWDYVCKGAAALLAGNAWTDYVQSRVVPAQYYRTLNASTRQPSEMYLAHSNFLADVNNERPVKEVVYKQRVAALRRFVMVVFSEDTTVIPKESGWFAEVETVEGGEEEEVVVTPLRERAIYKEDWLGLKALDAKKDGLVFRTVPGRHMEFKEGVLEGTIEEFFGPEEEEVGQGKEFVGLVEQGNGARL